MAPHVLRIAPAFVFATLLSACTTPAPLADPVAPVTVEMGAQQQFFDSIGAHCGKAYAGKPVSTDAADADMAGEAMVMHVSRCSEGEIRIPFHVGENRSRTWVLTRTANSLRLKHDHRHEDGSVDAISWYGGDTANDGSASRQEFPVDAESIALFTKNNMQVSTTNVWAVEIDAQRFAYELRREGRWFRVEFDLTRPVATPPPAWGS
jgi:hypothetical protein